jgi:hypothetical protein
MKSRPGRRFLRLIDHTHTGLNRNQSQQLSGSPDRQPARQCLLLAVTLRERRRSNYGTTEMDHHLDQESEQSAGAIVREARCGDRNKPIRCLLCGHIARARGLHASSVV